MNNTVKSGLAGVLTALLLFVGYLIGARTYSLPAYRYATIAAIYYTSAVVAIKDLHPGETQADADIRLDKFGTDMYKEMIDFDLKGMHRLKKNYKDWNELLTEKP